MKKNLLPLIAVLLALAIVLAGCGFETPDAPDTTDNSALQNTTNPPDTTDVPDTTDAPTGKGKFALGTFENGIYTNSYLGITCTLDNNWTLTPAEQLQTLPDNIRDVLDSTELGSMMDSYTQIIDMQAENSKDLTNISVAYTKIGLAERLVYMSMTEEEIIDSTLAMKDVLISSYEQVGITVNEMKKVSVTFLGQTHTAIWIDCSVQNIPCYMLQLTYFQLGEYGVTLSLGSYLEDKTADLLALFDTIE